MPIHVPQIYNTKSKFQTFLFSRKGKTNLPDYGRVAEEDLPLLVFPLSIAVYSGVCPFESKRQLSATVGCCR